MVWHPSDDQKTQWGGAVAQIPGLSLNPVPRDGPRHDLYGALTKKNPRLLAIVSHGGVEKGHLVKHQGVLYDTGLMSDAERAQVCLNPASEIEIDSMKFPAFRIVPGATAHNFRAIMLGSMMVPDKLVAEAISHSLKDTENSQLQGVLVTTCYGLSTAIEILEQNENIEYAIGASRMIPIPLAKTFHLAFMKALGQGLDYEDAFHLAISTTEKFHNNYSRNLLHNFSPSLHLVTRRKKEEVSPSPLSERPKPTTIDFTHEEISYLSSSLNSTETKSTPPYARLENDNTEDDKSYDMDAVRSNIAISQENDRNLILQLIQKEDEENKGSLLILDKVTNTPLLVLSLSYVHDSALDRSLAEDINACREILTQNIPQAARHGYQITLRFSRGNTFFLINSPDSNSFTLSCEEFKNYNFSPETESPRPSLELLGVPQ